MKKLFYTLLVLLITFIGCDKEEESNSNLNSSIYSGTYIGDVDMYINGIFHSNVSKTITLSELNTVNNYLMDNNIFMSTTCEISNGNLNIPNDTTAAASNYNVIEYFAYNDTVESNFLYWYGDRYNIYEIAISQNSRYISSLLALQDNPSAQEDNRSYQTYRWNSYVDYLKNNNSDNSAIKYFYKL